MTRPVSVLIVSVVLLLACSASSDEVWEPQIGDVVFHTSSSQQSAAVQAATGSKWSHVGMVVLADGEWAIVEAVQPVQVVTLKEFLARGVDGRFEAYRMKEPITHPQRDELSKVARSFAGQDYDLYFGWDDDLIYCSELVWKAYERALGIELSTPRKLTDFDLTSPAVAELMKRRWPDGVPDEVAVSPQDLADSALLRRVGKR
jgi:uncharacterized protein YycO